MPAQGHEYNTTYDFHFPKKLIARCYNRKTMNRSLHVFDPRVDEFVFLRTFVYGLSTLERASEKIRYLQTGKNKLTAHGHSRYFLPSNQYPLLRGDYFSRSVIQSRWCVVRYRLIHMFPITVQMASESASDLESRMTDRWFDPSSSPENGIT